jgi:putative peptide zinc metalloprotease protein
MISSPNKDQAEQAQEKPALPDLFPLRDGLAIHMRDSTHVTLEDSEREKFFRLGIAEGHFVAALIETGSPAEAYEACLVKNVKPVAIDHVEKLCKWLAINGMASPTEGAPPTGPARPPRNFLAAAFFWKVPLVNPDRWLTSIVNHCGWLFSPQAMLLGLLVFFIAIFQTSGHWSEFFESYQNLFSSWRWITLAIGWCVLKVIHETAHGATCRRYGGEVKEAGLAMILLMPIAFVNVTSSWRFQSRWQRFQVTMAGVAAELFVAGIALFVWHWCDALPIKQAAADIFMLASVSSLLFNLNPLLKFDGYFAIADASGIDNLYNYGQSYARYFGGRYLLGLNNKPPSLPGSRPIWIKIYGISAALYRVVTVTGLLTAAAVIFHGAGIVLAIAGVVSFIIKPLMMLIQYLRQLKQSAELSVPRLALRLTCLASLGIAALFVIPAQWTWTAPAIVQYDPPATVRTSSAGFVEGVHAVDGDVVAEGQPIITLRNDDLVLERSKLKKELAQLQQEILSAQWNADSSALNDARSRETGLLEQVREVQSQVDKLVLRASANGTLVSRRLNELQGTYLKTGSELAVIGNEDQKRLKLSLSQSDAKQSNTWKHQPLRVVVSGHGAWSANLSRLETRAEVKAPDDSLLAVNGGTLSSVQTAAGEFGLCEPRVNAFVTLTPGQSSKLRTGQRASINIASNYRSLGDLLLSLLGKCF